MSAAVAICTAAAAVYGQDTPNSVGEPALPCPVEPVYPALNLPLATLDSTVQGYIEKGFTDLLFGWEEHARMNFACAIQAGENTENDSLMSYCGMLLAADSAGAKDANRMALIEKIETIPSTPVEQFYLAALLKLASGDIAGAADDFDKRSLNYKRDIFSAAWAAMLLHCADQGYDSTGTTLPYQQRALEAATRFYENHPKNPLACYVRAYMEEGAPKVSETALKAASEAVELCPAHPMPNLLYGHLLYRSERVEEALPYLQNAVKFSVLNEGEASLTTTGIIASLYEVTALWSTRKENEALKHCAQLNAISFPKNSPALSAFVLREWEAKSFPLRALVLRATPPSVKEIREAAAVVAPDKPGKITDPLLHVRDCLRAALYARARVAQKDMANANKSLKLAEESLRKFEETKQEVFSRGTAYITSWLRAHESCRVAILAAGADVAADNDQSWKEIARTLVCPSTLLMPVSLPVQYGPEPVRNSPKPTTTPKSGKKQKKR